MDWLLDVPVLGVLLQLIGYLIEVIPRLAPNTLALATPIALGAMCGVMCERSGVVNIGIEGTMLIGAFVGFFAGVFAVSFLPTDPLLGPGTPFNVSLALLFAVGAAVASGMLISTLHAWLTISVRADQIVSGVIINIAAVGVTGYFFHFMPPGTRGAGIFRTFTLPPELVDLPFVGWLFSMFLRQGPIAMSVIIIVIVLQVLLFRSRWGLRTRAVGEHPRAADTVGIDVIRLRYRNVLIGGIFAGLAGAFLTLEANGSFQNGMTAGKGFIALACVIFGRWTPIGAFGAALLFAAADTLNIAAQGRVPVDRYPDLAGFLNAIPAEVFAALPYLLTLVVLASFVGRSVAPAAVGRPYEKESRA
jgi:simple sugar transport system permease protein